MAFSRPDLADLTYFLAIARHRNFRLAGLELGVSASALSHALKGLESRMGVRLVNRTNRSVTLTVAGDELRGAIERPFGEIGEAIEGLNRHRDAPSGRIRIDAVAEGAALVLAPVMAEFTRRYPDIGLDIATRDRIVDVVDEGFDAGIRYGGTVPEDMVSQRLSAGVRWVVAAAPSYFERHGTPERPEDLRHHQCLAFRLGDERPYRWEFEGPDGEFDVEVPSAIVMDGGRAMIEFAVAGVGLMYGVRPAFEPYLASGALRLVLEDWSTEGPGYHIYYPGRRQVPTGLRLLIDLIREARPLGL